MTDPRYPIGLFQAPAAASPAQVSAWIDGIAALPERLRARIAELDAESLERPYRPGGWNARQVVHHLVDSHVNSFVRFKLALTEEHPTIRPYDEARWVEQPDAIDCGLDETLALLGHLHLRWAVLLRGLDAAALERTYHHPEEGRDFRVWEAIGLYDWHGRHHLAHVESVLLPA